MHCHRNADGTFTQPVAGIAGGGSVGGSASGTVTGNSSGEIVEDIVVNASLLTKNDMASFDGDAEFIAYDDEARARGLTAAEENAEIHNIAWQRSLLGPTARLVLSLPSQLTDFVRRPWDYSDGSRNYSTPGHGASIRAITTEMAQQRAWDTMDSHAYSQNIPGLGMPHSAVSYFAARGNGATLAEARGAFLIGAGVDAGLGVAGSGAAASASRITAGPLGGNGVYVTGPAGYAAESVPSRLIGSYTPSANLKYGTTLFGDEAHAVAGRMLTEELSSRGVPIGSIIDRTRPGLTGIDMSVDPRFSKMLGFEHIEIKPNTANGSRTLNRQVERWGMNPSSVKPVTYDAHGNIWWGFDF